MNESSVELRYTDPYHYPRFGSILRLWALAMSQAAEPAKAQSSIVPSKPWYRQHERKRK